MKKTKIVCTIGPASEKKEVLEQLILSGMNVARLNFSHGSQDEHKAKIDLIRETAKRLKKPVAILQDIAGPKIRLGNIACGTINIKSNQIFTLTDLPVPGDSNSAQVNYPQLPTMVQAGDRILLCDGAIELEVNKTTEHEIVCKVINGGTLSSHKGVNLPTRPLGIPILTEKDKKDLLFGLQQEVDYIALSFVRNAADVLEVRKITEKSNLKIPLIAKIEKPEAVRNIEEILKEADGVMVARGDLGVEIPFEQVPMAQKLIISKANWLGKPVITATQMMESMVNSPRPTRAEVTDIANAILEGTDAIMLSEESATGNYPVEAVKAMSRVAIETEKSFPHGQWMSHCCPNASLSVEESVAHAACELAMNVNAEAIIAHTSSGSAVRRIAKYRPAQSIIAVTSDQRVYQKLSLIWGAESILLNTIKDIEQVITVATDIALETGWASKGKLAIVTAGMPLNLPGHTNVVRVITLGQRDATY